MGKKESLPDGSTIEWLTTEDEEAEKKKKEKTAKIIKTSGGLCGHVTIYYAETPDSSKNFDKKGYYVECQIGLNVKTEIIYVENLLSASKAFNEYYKMLTAPHTIEQ